MEQRKRRHRLMLKSYQLIGIKSWWKNILRNPNKALHATHLLIKIIPNYKI